ncbi:major facilitator superfamily domain-containing protein [Sporodiniella umbellata]|nr:major facilitator superfamily domain-containing protein [Sporodiniella umbellata]
MKKRNPSDSFCPNYSSIPPREEEIGDISQLPEQHDPEMIIREHLGNTTVNQVTLCSNLSVWIVTSYMLSATALQPLYGKLSDILGRKTTLITILCFFLLGSWLCGAANTIGQMSIARALAGLGGGGLATMASVMIHDLIPLRNRGKYQSYVNMAQTVGNTLGAPLGGLINDTLGWRYCFYLNVPPCFFMLYFYFYRLENYGLQRDTRTLKEIDWVGACLILIANTTLVIGTSLGGNTRAWSDPWVLALLISSGLFFLSFGIYEFKIAKYPVISRNMMRNQNVISICFSNFFLCSSSMAFIYLAPQFFMGVVGYNASSAGIWVLPRTLMVALGCWTAGRYLGYAGRYKYFIIIMLLIHVCATVGMFSWKKDSPLLFQMVCLNMEGFCFGCVLVATMIALVVDLPYSDTASATSMISLCRSMGWLTGSALAAAILQANLKSKLYQEISGPEAVELIEFIRTSISKIRDLDFDIRAIVIRSLEFSIHRAYIYGVVCSVLCFLSALGMKNHSLGS